MGVPYNPSTMLKDALRLNVFSCGESGHFARDCEKPKQLTGACFNCGEIGFAPPTTVGVRGP